MPRMDGIELVSLIKKDARLSTTTRDDRLLQGPRGGSAARTAGGRQLLPHEIQFSTMKPLLEAVADLIGESEA